jgi:fructose/tagatose bisphosphate aldolase
LPKLRGIAEKYLRVIMDTVRGDGLGWNSTEAPALPAKKRREAIRYGAIKMNIDTDIQWAFWSGGRQYEAKNHDYLPVKIDNPKGANAPNKKYDAPRIWL